MRRFRRLELSCLALLSCLGPLSLVACAGDDRVGTGFLDVADLRNPPMPEHFTGKAVRLEGRLALRANGCVTVVVDGVERMPLWPDGTDVAQESDRPTRYVVTLPDATTITVSDSTGDAFSALGIIDDNPDPFEVEAGLPTKISSFLAYCGVEARPVAFPDADTFSVRPI